MKKITAFAVVCLILAMFFASVSVCAESDPENEISAGTVTSSRPAMPEPNGEVLVGGAVLMFSAVALVVGGIAFAIIVIIRGKRSL